MAAGTAGKHRSWVSPITTGCFLALGITGLMMMSHMRIGGVRALHEGMGILFCIVGVFHLILNWRTLLSYLRTRKGIIATAAIIILGAFMLFGGGDERGEGPHGRHGGPPPAQSTGPEI
jgi:hypothetical protein